ncbi:hypothetical protein MMC11_002841 [Xylographa trunciseda]|nr:hypothetical protein [Xylographa trunciseda]
MPTIPALKQSFLQSQIRLLSTPLSPSPTWRDHVPNAPPNPLTNELVQDVVHKVNALIRAHNLRVYPAAALRHVAEQIDALYWAAGAPDEETGEDGAGMVGRGVDLRDDEAIHALPDEWPEEDSADASGLEMFAEAARYKQLRARLVTLSGARAAQRAKLAQMQQLRELLRPFERAQETVQPNLVTRDGELAREVERMKVLMARVGDKIGGLERRHGLERGVEIEDVDAREKIDAILRVRPVELGGD